MQEIIKIQKQIRGLLLFFIIALIVSGLTAFPLESELSMVNEWCSTNLSEDNTLRSFIQEVYTAISVTYKNYPFIAYGTDWLAFAHIVIAVFFIGVLKDPIRNNWIIQSGVIACILVIPLAFIAGEVRGIPVYWRMIDCSFGIFGIVPLLGVNLLTQRLLKLREEIQRNELYRQKGVLRV